MKITLMKWTDPEVPTRRSRLELTRTGVVATLETYRSSRGPTQSWETDDYIAVYWPSVTTMVSMARRMVSSRADQRVTAEKWVADQKRQAEVREAAVKQMRLEEVDREGSLGEGLLPPVQVT